MHVVDTTHMHEAAWQAMKAAKAAETALDSLDLLTKAGKVHTASRSIRKTEGKQMAQTLNRAVKVLGIKRKAVLA